MGRDCTKGSCFSQISAVTALHTDTVTRTSTYMRLLVCASSPTFESCLFKVLYFLM
jgi:hypothetical protein